MLAPLGDAAAPRPARTLEEADLVFSTTGRTPVSGFSKTKSRIDARMQFILGDKFQPWRTQSSGQAYCGLRDGRFELSASRDRACLESRLSGAKRACRSYQRHEYREERRRAIMAWYAHVMGLLSAVPCVSAWNKDPVGGVIGVQTGL